MAVEPAAPRIEAHPTVFVDTFTDGLLGPDVEMLGPVRTAGMSWSTPHRAAGGR